MVDSEILHFQAWKQILKQHGTTSLTEKVYLNYVGTSNEHLAEDFITTELQHLSVKELVLEKQQVYLELIPEITLLPGVRELVSRCHGRYSLSIASSSHLVELEKILTTLELTEYFSSITGGDMVEQKKPAPDIYLQTIQQLALKPAECVAFEDSESGVKAAKEAGIYCIAIPNHYSHNHNFSRADRIVSDFHQVSDSLLADLVNQDA